ncbi:component of SufBCD complex [Phaeobacter gallaeciensis]|uniref:Component of SufBCD complex n=1 Tax=Phaeobacter gallaeciensis TaxID=60890 RepID=A0ABD4X5C5_9RHOB|nr:component of SufBCD complex [Phaeobacter gallaeciensis]MDF1773468.1 component of SufBCD complex [Pseudophaeobacter sp. bin_em_oilr2.035]MDE4143564.1 component of SufBCD complex [Phaeobacter gallaeciensis]MDE4156074.1 component of SufBCD complex [Phaeobacter gallaeciensis]MDE4160262.1 component of SufBCD complex [Phaeobacter gallaeciensis]MDE4164644.1 component of SufBCD complex [Phaeobacter gallaeciensis]
MDLFQTLTEMIDLRSFSNLWYWIALAVMWSTASHWILGVPFDMVHRARKNGGQSAEDLEDLVRINVNRMLYVVQMAGLWILAIACFVLSSLATLGFGLDVEFAQAVFLLLFPMATVSLVNLATARSIRMNEPQGDALYRRLATCRFAIQIIGMISIFVTAMWGMYQNLRLGVFG